VVVTRIVESYDRQGRIRDRGPALASRMGKGRPMPKLFLPLMAVLAACAPVAQNGSHEATAATGAAMLVRSAPAEGAVVRAPQSLSLTFREPVRLVELIVAGPAGEMPMMITAAGEQTSYSIPLPELEPGRHEVRWRAVGPGGASHEGRLSFTVR
jgi:methionine-rich copper-binding protein CopC